MRSQRITIAVALALTAGCGGTSAHTEEPAQSVEAPPPPEETAAEASGPPVAEQRPVTNTYHGTEVVDPYQWLENPDDPAVQAWSDAENTYARRLLTGLPNIAAIHERVQALMAAPTRSHYGLIHRGGKIFGFERRPPREQPFVVVMDSVDAPDEARVIVDPTALDASGAISIDWFVPSPDGRLVAASLSRGGSERGDVHVFDEQTGQQVHEVIEHVNGGTAGGDLAWMPDASGFFYTRYPRPGERSAEDENFYQQLYFHRLGTPAGEDRYELGRDFPRIAEIQLHMHDRSGRLLATVQNGDGGEFAMYLRERDGNWRQFSTFDDGIVQAAFGPSDDLYIVSRHEAPRGKVLRVPIRTLDVAHGTVVIPEGENSIVTDFWGPPTVLPMRTKLYVTYQTGGPSELRFFDLRGRALRTPEQPPVSAIRALVALTGDDVLYRLESYVQPPAWYRVEGRNLATHQTALRETSPVDTSGWQVRREMATSRDGTEVPVNILLPGEVEMNGQNPCVVNGYGGYGVNIEPRFRPLNAMYLNNGVVFAVVNLRGGAEFGEAWHEQGSLTHKQNVFDDFAAALQHMIERGYTSPERLAIIGGSNGGLLMGAMITQHPELMKAVVSFVGIYDMLRVELSPNGAFNVTEFGSVENPEQFQALYAYSPYHHVREGECYPPVLLTTAEGDSRVDPMHARKMAAMLQWATSCESNPVLLIQEGRAGHGVGKPVGKRAAEAADVLTFFSWQLGLSP